MYIMADEVNNPEHYSKYLYPVIDLTEQFSNNIGNAIKYILRAPYKGKYEQDMQKAIWYLNRTVKQKEKFHKVKKSTIELAATYQSKFVDSIVEAVDKNSYELLEWVAEGIQFKLTLDRVTEHGIFNRD